jgi:hypothetical protein
MGTSPDDLTRQIETTRTDLADDVNRLVDRASPREMARRRAERVRGAARNVRDKVMGTSDSGSRGVQQAKETLGNAQSKAADVARAVPERVTAKTEGNPIAAGLIAFGAGLLVASLIPTSRTEERLAGDLKERSAELVEPVREALKESAQSVGEGVQETVRQSVSEVKDSAREAVDTTTREVRAQADDVGQHAREAGRNIADNRQ